MFFSPTSFRSSTRLPLFTGKGKERESVPEQNASQSASSAAVADSFQPQKQVPSLVAAATSTLTNLLKGRTSKAPLAESSEGPGAVQNLPHRGIEQQGSKNMLPIILEQSELGSSADTQSGSAGEHRKAARERRPRKTVPPGTRRPKPTQRLEVPKKELPRIEVYGNLKQDIVDAMEDPIKGALPDSPQLRPISGEQRLLNPPASPLPLHVPHWSNAATSLGLGSKTPSRGLSTRASSPRPNQPQPSAHSDDLESSQFSDTTSAWLAAQDEDVQDERAAWANQKNTRATESHSELSESDDEEDLSDHSLEGDSQLDNEELALYREELWHSKDSDSDDAGSVSKKSVPRAIPKRKDPFAEFFHSKSPKEVQADSLRHPSLLSKALMSPETRKIHDLISSFREKAEREYANLNEVAIKQKQQKENDENIRLCSKYSLEGLRQRRSTLANHLGYNQYRANKWLNDLRMSDWLRKVGIPQDAVMPHALDVRLAELNTKNIELTSQLEGLPHPGLGKRSRSVSNVMRERDVIQQDRDKISDQVAEIESNLHTYEAFLMRLERINIQLYQNNHALLMKRKALILNQLNAPPEAQDERVHLWQNLADNSSPEELDQIRELLTKPEELAKYKKLLDKEFTPNVQQEEILRKAKDFQKSRRDDLANLLKKMPATKDDHEDFEQRLAQNFTYRELMRVGYQLSRQNHPGNDPQITMLQNAIKRQSTKQ